MWAHLDAERERQPALHWAHVLAQKLPPLGQGRLQQPHAVVQQQVEGEDAQRRRGRLIGCGRLARPRGEALEGQDGILLHVVRADLVGGRGQLGLGLGLGRGLGLVVGA